MRSKLFILTLAVLIIPVGYVFAGKDMVNKKDKGMDTPKAVEVGNKVCPVSGERIPASGEKGEMGEAVQYEYNGKIYNLCCPSCRKDFKKDPEKYSKIADDEVAKEKISGLKDLPGSNDK